MNIKYDLIDLVNFGSHARKDVHPSVIITKEDSLNYPAGDILDANSVAKLLGKSDKAVAAAINDLLFRIDILQNKIDSLENRVTTLENA